MKSDKAVLRKRGYFDKEDLSTYKNENDEKLWLMMNGRVPHLSSIAVQLLFERGYLKQKEFQDYLIERLYIEKRLYTKITICDVLAKGDDQLAIQLSYHLGRIGNNQHKVIRKTSFKKSYPIARDIIARTMSNMNISDKCLLALFDLNDVQLKEALDVIGYQLFYHPEIAQETFFIKIKNLLETSEDQLIIWKCLTCLSGFYIIEVKELLTQFLNSNNLSYKSEAQRSLRLIEGRYHI